MICHIFFVAVMVMIVAHGTRVHEHHAEHKSEQPES